MPIQATREEVYTRGGILDSVIDNCFDACVLIDKSLRIIHHAKGGDEFFKGVPYEKTVGMSIKDLDHYADFETVIKTGKPSKYSFTIISGRQCIHHIIPIYEKDELIAILAGVIFKDLSVLKKVLVENYVDNEDANNLYDKISRIETNYEFHNFIGKSPAVLKALDRCRKLATTKNSVLIIGETGTGKEILANGIHAESFPDLKPPFIKINCSAIPGELLEAELFGYEKGSFTGASSRKIGKFELAENGTILLDEIGDMDLKIQAKLLRALEEKEFERIGSNRLIPLRARIIASTNKNLLDESQKGIFRSDLYYRLCHFEIYLPPLRERREDIPMLLDNFINTAGHNIRFTAEAVNLLMDYNWPGNVRQLRNVVNAFSVWNDNDIIDEDDICDILKLQPHCVHMQKNMNVQSLNNNLFDYVDVHEKEYIIQVLQKTEMNVAEAARILNINRRTMYNKIKKYDIKLERSSLQ